MPFEEIICAIQEKPEIWMSKHALYKNRLVKAKIWTELAEKLGIEEVTLKKRWKHLKDQYRKELKKQPHFRSGAEADVWVSSWQYFNLMMFIKDEVMPAPSTGNLSVNETDDSQEAENIENDEDSSEMPNDSDNLDSEMMQPMMSPPSQPAATSSASSSQQSSSSSRKRLNLKESMLDIEKKKLLFMEKRLMETDNDQKLNNDEDFLFLRSILPAMKKLTELQKFQFRGKVNEWLYEATKENQAVTSQQNVNYQCYYTTPPDEETQSLTFL
ncbi:unnamed protein product [Acanthoscelides obtectus]|uniref:MADF domain-containing protein n=1 Tax=Acanthoscelides obtectus TaxID=200917 RepID=A0A9P0PA43_ACAOB|nr:unnamed protein product [Acanthoscelides obtectus]CAK1630686.1 Transcription factor Adf-1 [Acanthoscelides obtectus]